MADERRKKSAAEAAECTFQPKTLSNAGVSQSHTQSDSKQSSNTNTPATGSGAKPKARAGSQSARGPGGSHRSHLLYEQGVAQREMLRLQAEHSEIYKEHQELNQCTFYPDTQLTSFQNQSVASRLNTS